MTKTHAELINEQYLKSDSHFVTLRERLADTLKTSIINVGLLTGVVDEFKRRNKQWKTFVDLALCKAIMVPMDKILIDTTMLKQWAVKSSIMLIHPALAIGKACYEKNQLTLREGSQFISKPIIGSYRQLYAIIGIVVFQ